MEAEMPVNVLINPRYWANKNVPMRLDGWYDVAAK
jgi:hypothetical protein